MNSIATTAPIESELLGSEQPTQDGLNSTDRIPSTFVMTRSKDASEKFAVDYLNELFKTSQENGISDVHFESLEVGNICRVRKDGKLRQYGSLLTDHQFSAIREKIYSRGQIEESYAKTYQVDARGWLRYGTRLDLRISSIPTTHGYSIVIRLLDQSNSGRRLADVEMAPAVRDAIFNSINSAHGLILITGPTGSGKTTTLYSYLNEINSPESKVFTIENPVEYSIHGVQHVNVDMNITMANALRTALRQDPDIILVGEIRDYETAKTAIEAAQTGHLVLSTLHTNSSVGALSRLMEMGIEASHINETLIAVSAQRLVRKCKSKRNTASPSDLEAEWLRRNNMSHLVNQHFGRGIDPKNYKGRLPIIEFLVMTDEIREKVSQNRIEDIYEIAKKQPQYETLTECAVRNALEGLTSLEEAMSISKASSLMNMDGMMLGERLVALKYLTQTQLEYARSEIEKTSAIKRVSLKDFLLEKHFCTIEQLAEVKDAPDFF
ncbi:type II/IV secretion system protein [Acinetobacter radioresistens]|uniref:GspE/PulE family protein n=1 Tax=Acinetobacter radioresistens TaxID=40216 RepID=UPI0020043457|nr:GspE/PulE family protein [Acinetobacter radioresistens]MCK4083682.1 type II/IV secretion system protein [Acinetobacter radioresistens]